MHKKTAGLITVMLTASILLTGCGSTLTKLDDEQTEMVSEYAVSLLLKYDSENHSRLTDTSEFMDQYNAALKVREDGIKAYEEEKAAKEAEKEKESKTYTEEMNAAATDNGTAGATVVDDNAETTVKQSIGEFLGLNGFSIDYAGYDLLNSYPEDAVSTVTASSGKQLLAVYFNVTAANGGTLDMFDTDATFKISINGGSYISSNLTILDDDLAQYLGDFTQGETKRLVLIFEISESASVSSLSLDTEDALGNVLITKLN